MRKESLESAIEYMRHEWTPRKGICMRMQDIREKEMYRVCCGAMSNPYLVAERCNIWDSEGNLVYQGDFEADPIYKAIKARSVHGLEFYIVERRDAIKKEKC